MLLLRPTSRGLARRCLVFQRLRQALQQVQGDLGRWLEPAMILELCQQGVHPQNGVA